MDRGFSAMQQRLQKFQMDEAIFPLIKKKMEKGDDFFDIVFRPAPTHSAQPELFFTFEKKADGTYDTRFFDIMVYKSVKAFPEAVNGCQLPKLIKKLSNIDTSVYKTTSAMQEMMDTVQHDSKLLTYTIEGQKWAEIIKLKYWTDYKKFEHWTPSLIYVPERDQYCSITTIDMEQRISLDAAIGKAVNELEKNCPHLYYVKLSVTELDTGAPATLLSKATWPDLIGVISTFNRLSPIYFDNQALQQLQLPWAVQEAAIYDRVDDQWVARKSVKMEADQLMVPELTVNREKTDVKAVMKLATRTLVDPVVPREQIAGLQSQFRTAGSVKKGVSLPIANSPRTASRKGKRPGKNRLA